LGWGSSGPPPWADERGEEEAKKKLKAEQDKQRIETLEKENEALKKRIRQLEGEVEKLKK